MQQIKDPSHQLKILQLIYKPDHLLPLFNTYAKVLMAKGYHVTTLFLTGQKNNTTITATLANHIDFCGFSTNQIKTKKLMVSRKIRQIWRQNNFDLVICHRHKPSFVFSLARLGLKHAPMLSVVHALDQYKRKSRRLHARLLYRSISNTTLIAAVSDAVNANIQKDFNFNPPCSVLTIPNIIDIDKVTMNQLDRGDARQQLGLDKNDFVIGNVARLVTDKAQHDLLTAFSTILKSDEYNSTNIKLVIIGSGKLEVQLKQYADSMNLSQAVIFAGDVKHASRLMTAFDVFVLSSIVEPFGLVLLEAMAAKLPIVSTNVGSIPSIANKGTQLVSPGNPQELALAIKTIVQLDTSQRRIIGDAGYAHLINHFNESQFQQVLVDAINQTVNDLDAR